MKKIQELTKLEYEQMYGKPKKNTTITGGFSTHKAAVEQALIRGEQVADEVLAGYNDLFAAKLLSDYCNETISRKNLEILFDCAFNRGQILANVVHMQWFHDTLIEYLKGE